MKKRKNMDLGILLLIFASIILGVCGQISLKMGMREIGNLEFLDIFSPKIISIIFNKFVFLGLLSYLIASLLWLVILSKAELSFAYPMLSIGYIIIAIIGKLLFNESLTSERFLGIILITIGVFLLLRSFG